MQKFIVLILAGFWAVGGSMDASFAGEAAKDSAGSVDAIIAKLRTSPSDASLLDALAKAALSVQKEDVKSRALAICYTGYMLLNRADMAEKAKRVLDKDCAMSDYKHILDTNDVVVVGNCEKCNGTTKIDDVCPDCRGVVPKWTGDVAPNMQNATQCSACQGRGSKPGVGGKPIQCAKCRGMRICTKCNGTGKISIACKICKEGKTRNVNSLKLRTLYNGFLQE